MIPPINSTELCTAITNKTTFEVIATINQEPHFLIPLIVAFALSFLIFLLMGCFLGKKNESLMETPNYRLLIMCWFILAILLILVIFPIYYTVLGG